MTASRQIGFDVYRVADCGSVERYSMKWPAATATENLKVTVTDGADPLWTAAQLRSLATRIEGEQSEVNE